MLALIAAFAGPPTETSDLQVLVTGGLDGISAGDVVFEAHRQLAPGKLDAVRATHGWMSHDGWLLAADSLRVADTLTVLQALDARSSEACERVDEVEVLDTGHEVLVAQQGLPRAFAQEGKREFRTAWRCELGGQAAHLVGPEDATNPTPPSTVWTDWEFRRSLRMTLAGVTVDTIAVPAREGTRLYTQLQRERATEGLVYVDAGNFVDGFSSVRDGGLSLHRPAAFAMLDRLAPDALAPGLNELAGGVQGLLDEAPDLPWVASNWESTDPALDLPDHHILVTQQEGVEQRIAVVAALDPALLTKLPVLEAEGITLTDPVSAIQAVVDQLPPVDAVLLLTSASPDRLQAWQRRWTGIDLLLGDTRSRPTRATRQTFALNEGSVAPVLPVPGAVRAALRLQNGTVDRVATTRVEVSGRLDPDPATRSAVTQVRAQSYPALDRDLLPPPAERPTDVWPQADWSKIVCEAVLDEAHADVALLPGLPTDRRSPGAVTALVASDWLASGDVLEVHHVPGGTLKRLLDQLTGAVDLSCGAPLGSRFPKTGGRLLEGERLYTLVTTDTLRESSIVGTLLQAARSSRLLDQPGFHVVTDAQGPLSLRRGVVQRLTRLEQDLGPSVSPTLLARSFTDRTPLWLLRVGQASLTLEGFRGADDPAYADVPETLVTSPSSFTLGSAVDVALDYSSARFAWDVRVRSLLTRLSTEETTVETADDLKLSTSAQLPGVATPPAAGLSFIPFGEALVDTEWTIVPEAPQRQADASMTVGLAAKRVGLLRTLRLGVLLNRDLALPDKNTEVGGRVEVQTRTTLGPGMFWINQIDGFVYADTADQDASDLRFKTQLETRVDLPLSRWLSTGVYGRAFVFQGRVDATRAVRYSAAIGASISIGGAFDL